MQKRNGNYVLRPPFAKACSTPLLGWNEKNVDTWEIDQKRNQGVEGLFSTQRRPSRFVCLSARTPR